MMIIDGRSCGDCGGPLTVTGGSVGTGRITLDCPQGHQSTVTWPPGHPGQAQIQTPEYQRSVQAALGRLLGSLPRKSSGT